MRNMDVIEMTQTVGRVLRKGGDDKTYGFCVVPVYSKLVSPLNVDCRQ